ATADVGWFHCNGAAVSRTTYAALFARIGTTYGVGDGSTTFNLPDLRGRVVAGYDAGAATGRLTSGGAGINSGVMGAAGGAQTHTLTTAEMPAHSHNVNDPGHAHFYYNQAGGFQTENVGEAGSVASTAVVDTL